MDYGLLDEAGALLGNPVHYRDARTEGVRVPRVPAAELYAVTGTQHLPFNTIYQLAATPMLRHAATMLLIPDLLAYWLTGQAGAEVTNASTTSLFDVRAQAWATGLIEKAGLPPRIFPPLRRPGEVIGPILGPTTGRVRRSRSSRSAPTTRRRRWRACRPQAPASPTSPPDLVAGRGGAGRAGADRASRAANFTNETGIDGTIRYLRNVMGLWLLQESLRTLAAEPRSGRCWTRRRGCRRCGS